MKKYGLLLLALAGYLAMPAFAADKKEITECDMQENVYIVANFTVLGQSNEEVKKKFDDKVQLLSEVAKENNIIKLANITWNYNINSQTMNYDNGTQNFGFFLNASGNYQIDSLDDAYKLANALRKQKFQTRIEVNRFRKAGCEVPFN